MRRFGSVFTISALLVALRIGGEKGEAFQALAHL
jgi:hypothetical protein